MQWAIWMKRTKQSEWECTVFCSSWTAAFEQYRLMRLYIEKCKYRLGDERCLTSAHCAHVFSNEETVFFCCCSACGLRSTLTKQHSFGYGQVKRPARHVIFFHLLTKHDETWHEFAVDGRFLQPRLETMYTCISWNQKYARMNNGMFSPHSITSKLEHAYWKLNGFYMNRKWCSPNFKSTFFLTPSIPFALPLCAFEYRCPALCSPNILLWPSCWDRTNRNKEHCSGNCLFTSILLLSSNIIMHNVISFSHKMNQFLSLLLTPHIIRNVMFVRVHLVCISFGCCFYYSTVCLFDDTRMWIFLFLPVWCMFCLCARL